MTRLHDPVDKMKEKCRLCLENVALAKAHIIPRFFFNSNHKLFSSNLPYSKKRPMGAYDTTILCAECDNKIGNLFDQYAKEVLLDKIDMTSETVELEKEKYQLYRLSDKSGYDKLKRFFISVLWRASISSLPDFESFNLGPYEEEARQAILNEAYDYSQWFSASICLLSDILTPIHIYSSNFTRIEGINFYVMTIGFYKCFFKCDKRRAPKGISAFSLSKENDVLMLEDKFKNMPENSIPSMMLTRKAKYRDRKF